MLKTGMEIYSIDVAPSWVKERQVLKYDKDGESPFSYPLADYQELVEDSRISSYRDTYQCINDASRIEDASLLLTELHQGSQVLVIHELSIFRDGEKIDALDEENISAIQRERSLESHITDNRITVSISVDDLRVGDHLQFRSTIIEIQNEHPFHGRHYSVNFSLSWTCPVNFQSIRIVNKSEKQLNILYQGLNNQKDESYPEIIEPGSEFEREYFDIPIERMPSSAPNWVWGSFLQVSSKASWNDISQYLYEYFEDNNAISSMSFADVMTLNIFSDEDSLESKALKVIRFVQNNVRYRGENHGVFTHTPKPSERTLKKRSGDCKDKSNLMVSMLTALGLNAYHILVNTSYGEKVKEFNPSPYHFNHMIVGVEFEGNHYYIDPTIQKQEGDFEHMAQLNYGVGLPLFKKGGELINVTRLISNRVFELTHRFKLPKDKSGAVLEIERVYFSHRADNMRSYFSSNEKSKYQQDFLEWAKGDTDLQLSVVEAIEISQDDHVLNKLTTLEHYQIVDLGKSHENKHIELLTDFYREFTVPNSDDFPARIDLDGTVQHEIFVTYDRRPDMDLSTEKIDSHAFEYMDLVENIKGNQLHYLTRVTPLRDYVAAGSEIKKHREKVERMRQRSNNLIRHKNKGALSGMANNSLSWYLGFVALCLAIKAIMRAFGE